MPDANWGAYTINGTVSTEVSSTYEGRHITCTAAELITEDGSGVATKGKACVFGLTALQAVGVCFNTGTLTDLIAIDTEGIWNLHVDAVDDGGNVIVYPGDPLYINTATCVISKIRDNASQVPFGYALAQIASGETDTVCPVKVHWDPKSHELLDQEKLYFGDAADVSIQWNETFLAVAITAASKAVGLEMAISAAALADGYGFFETNANVAGAATGYVAARSDWLNLAADFEVMAGGGLITPHTDGIYESAGATLTDATIALCGKFTDQMASSDFGMYNLWNLNLTQTLTALFEVNNPALFGYVAGSASNVVGSLPIFHTGGGATKYIMVYDGPAS